MRQNRSVLATVGRRARQHAAVGLVACSLVACDGEPATVYVPGSGFREELFVTTHQGRAARVGVGEPIQLLAQRRSGPWRAVPETVLEDGECSLASRPPELEAEVAANLTWTAFPEGHATFDTVLREDRTRVVRFDAPGRYVLTAESPSWCGEPFGGDTLLIEIVE